MTENTKKKRNSNKKREGDIKQASLRSDQRKKKKMQVRRKGETDSPCALLNGNLTRALK